MVSKRKVRRKSSVHFGNESFVLLEAWSDGEKKKRKRRHEKYKHGQAVKICNTLFRPGNTAVMPKANEKKFKSCPATSAGGLFALTAALLVPNVAQRATTCDLNGRDMTRTGPPSGHGHLDKVPAPNKKAGHATSPGEI